MITKNLKNASVVFLIFACGLNCSCSFMQGSRVEPNTNWFWSNPEKTTQQQNPNTQVEFYVKAGYYVGWSLNPLNWVDLLLKRAPLKNDDEARGFRYYLPKPFVLVTPQEDGKMDIKFLIVPDQTEEYTVSAWAIAARHDFNLMFSNEPTEEHILKQVIYNPDNTGFAGKLLESIGTVGDKVIEQAVESAKAEEEIKKKELEELEKLNSDIQEATNTLAISFGVAETKCQAANNDSEALLAWRTEQIKLRTEYNNLSNLIIKYNILASKIGKANKNPIIELERSYPVIVNFCSYTETFPKDLRYKLDNSNTMAFLNNEAELLEKKLLSSKQALGPALFELDMQADGTFALKPVTFPSDGLNLFESPQLLLSGSSQKK